jgi:hypothetical protein
MATVRWTTEREGGTLVSPKLGEVAGVRIVVWLKEEHGVPHIQTVGEQEHRALAHAAWDAARRGETFDPGAWR